jgi:hypothetical protein
MDLVVSEPFVAGAGDVRANQTLVDRSRQGREYVRVRGDEPEEVRAPGGEGNHIDQSQGREPRAMKQVGPQRNRASIVVSYHVRRLELPVVEQVVEELALYVERDRVVAVLRRLAVAGHVPEIRGVVGGEDLGDRRP